jgi:hypothetical protein
MVEIEIDKTKIKKKTVKKNLRQTIGNRNPRKLFTYNLYKRLISFKQRVELLLFFCD